MSRWHTIPGLALLGIWLARYDRAALRVDPPVPIDPACDAAYYAQSPLWARLQAWCLAGAGSGRWSFWRPAQLPDVPQRFSVALLDSANAAQKYHLAHAFSQYMDGTEQLLALSGRVARWRLKLAVKAHDCMAWRARQPTDPWDSGYLSADPQALQALVHFLPRRASLLVCVDMVPDALQRCIQILRARSSQFRHPVRLLLVGGDVSTIPDVDQILEMSDRAIQ